MTDMFNMCLAMHFLGTLVWVVSQADIFATSNTLPMSGIGSNYVIESKYSNLPDNDLKIKITEKDLNNSVIFANFVLNSMKRLETNLGWSDIRVKTGTPSHGMFISFSPEREAVKKGKDALIAMKASLQLLNTFCNKHNLNHLACAKYLTNFKFGSTSLKASCSSMENNCSEEEYLSAYRSLDGSCNHVLNGKIGESFTGFTRLLYPDYLDGIHEPRRAVDKRVLPNPRTISMTAIGHDVNLDEQLTLAVMQWGQFLEHDLSRPATAIMIHTEKPIECCSVQGNNLSPRYIHPFCSPIYISPNDKYYGKKNLGCMNYVRSIPALRSDCSFGPTDQINQATHFLDGSQIYGSTFRKSSSLRSFVDGKLKMSFLNDKTYLPLSKNPAEDCQVSEFCYKSGDSRVNFQPQLTAMHTIWFREHNRIAKKLAEINSQWDDEIIFQETRRIVIAEMQHITYNEWINKILSYKYRGIIGVDIYKYDENTDPSVGNSFATAAMRSMKSLYDENIRLYNENRETNSSLGLQKYFNNPNKIQQPGIFDDLIRGLATQRSQKIDRHYAEDLINKLYTNGHFGFDVFSMDIQRGRDHGLPGYTQYRTLCGLQKAVHFNDFSDVMSEKHIKILSEIYSNPRDVDLIVGGIFENAIEDSVFGPTFSCIIADQFKRTKNGDRYFYTNENQPKPFSAAQLNEIKKVTLARIFCDNGDNITFMQRDVFKTIGASNSLVSCRGENIPHLSLSLWDENRGRYINEHY